MSWTEADVVALEEAVKSGILTVQYNDRRITYQSLTEMRALLAEMRRATSTAPKTTLATTRKGF